jgi:hypothetical protein
MDVTAAGGFLNRPQEDEEIEGLSLLGEEATRDPMSIEGLSLLSDEGVEEAAPVTVKRSQLLEGDTFDTIARYMDNRHGMTQEDYSKEEIVDSYMETMRKFAVGQSITTAGELTHLMMGSDEDRAIVGDAYQLYDNLEGVFESDTATLGDKVESVYDHAKGLILDPTNLVSLGVGKLFTMGGSKAAATLAKEAGTLAAQKVAREAGESAAKSALSRAAASAGRTLTQTEIATIRNRALAEAAESTATKKAARQAERLAYEKALRAPGISEVLKETGVVTATDVVMNVGVDYMYQLSNIYAGTQEEYSKLQGGISAVGALVGGGLSLLMASRRGTAGQPLASTEIDRLVKESQDAAAVAKKLDSKKVANDLKEDLDKLFSPFAERVQRGTQQQIARGAVPYTDEVKFFENLFYGNADIGVKGLYKVMLDSGFRVYVPRGEGDNLTNFVFDVIEQLPDAEKKQITSIVVDKFGPQYKGKEISEVFDEFSSRLSTGARLMNLQSQMSKMMVASQGKTLEESTVAEALEELANPVDAGWIARFADKLPDTIETMQRNLIRMIVTHPGTTALNVKGWLLTSGAQSASDVVRATLYGGASALNLLAGRGTTSLNYFNKSRQLINLQRQKLRNAIDPTMSYEAAMSYWSARPAVQKEILQYMAGGIEDEKVLKSLGLKPGEKLTQSKTEKVMDFFQTIYGVKAQDMISKSQEFMYNIDKQIRLKYNMSYIDFIKSPMALTEMTGDAFIEIESRAVSDTLKTVLSKPYGKGKDVLAPMAKAIEDLRRIPVVGAMAPFGQFFNNTLALMADYSGLSLIHKYTMKGNQDPWDATSKALVGWTAALYYFYPQEKRNLEEGLAWHEDRTPDGTVVSELYDFPLSIFKMVGRMLAHIEKDGGVPRELTEEALATFGIAQLSRQLASTSEGLNEFIIALGEGDAGAVELGKQLVGTATSQYISGFTRPLDPINQFAALARGEDYKLVDRKQGNEYVNNSVRYVDQVFSLLTGEDIAVEKKSPVVGEPARPPIGRIFGYREVDRHSVIQKAFREAGRADWMTNLSSEIPEANNAVNGIIFPIVENLATKLVQTEQWKEGSIEDRRTLLNAALSVAKRETLAIMEASLDPTNNKTKKIYEITQRGGRSEKAIRNAMDALGFKDMKMTDLSYAQLELLDFYIKDESIRKKMMLEDVGLE